VAADALEIRIAHLEGACEQIDRRLGAVEAGIQSLRSEVQGLRSEMYAWRAELVARMDRQFFWVRGLLIASIFLPVAFRLTGH
jgi:hypothetical protein